MPLPFQPKPLDADAADFIRRSGATDRAAINAFVRGVKALGLWNNMVCWPLRSAQNAGNGDTVHSLGGLGTFNGTRVNGPAWTADGIALEPQKWIDIRFGSSRGPTSAMVGVVTKSSNNQGSGFPYCASLGTNDYTSEALSVVSFGTSGNTWTAESIVASAAAVRTSARNNTDGIFRWTHAQKTASNVTLRVNNSTHTASVAGGATYDRFISSGRWSGNVVQNGAVGPFAVSYTGTHAFMFVLEGTGDFYDAYTLYKQTLGTGLGLP